jgi:heat shock protein HslJ
MNTRSGIFLCGAALAALSTACVAMTDGKPPASLDGTSWVLASLPGRDLANGSPLTLQFQSGRAAGSDSCNRYTRAYQENGSRVTFTGTPASTLMACPPGLQLQAGWYHEALAAARTGSSVDNRLVLLDEHGAEVARFAPVSQALAGTSWVVTGINNGKGGVASLYAGSTVTLVFGTDGAVSGSSGCNRYTGRFEQSGNQLKLPAALASTRRMCADAAVMDQERAFLMALPASTSVHVEGRRLELRDSSGALQISAAGT